MILRGQCCCFQITVDSSKTVFIVSKKNAKPGSWFSLSVSQGINLRDSRSNIDKSYGKTSLFDVIFVTCLARQASIM